MTEPIFFKLRQGNVQCLSSWIFWQSFKHIGAIKESIHLSNISSLSVASKLIETNQMSAIIYSSNLVIKFEIVYQVRSPNVNNVNAISI